MTMSATPAFSPRLRDSSNMPSSRPNRPTLASRPSTRTPASVGQPLPPMKHNNMHTPRTPKDAAQTPQTPSPNYFGLQVESTADVFASSAAQHIQKNWSPPTSQVRSTAAASPRVVPLDQNPEFELFRRQSENNKGFNLGKLGDFTTAHPLSRSISGGTNSAPPSKGNLPAAPQISVKDENLDTPQKPRSPKRLLSSDSTLFPDRPRRNSPASFVDSNTPRLDEEATFLDDGHARPSLPPTKSFRDAGLSHHRAETLPETVSKGEKTDEPTLVTPQHILNILESSEDQVLLLDLRVSTQYARGRIRGALSLCIPTTLLKRPSFNVQKLAETFKEEDEKEKFGMWRSSKYIIVYDASSSQLKDATTCVNTLKKFSNEGWNGALYIIRGGYSEFAQKFPSWISRSAAQGSRSASSSSLSLESDGPAVAPVIGGCPMPATQNAANPFFGNIRQNMDLIGGVGQLSIKHPVDMTNQMEADLPAWVRQASDTNDHGKRVSDKFLQIEKREQKRMQEALSGKVHYGTPGAETNKTVQIAGIEKGSKNRYNNIWPYEHSRVKIEGVHEGGCDYVNANHVQAGWSNKRYIATQGPIPATFNDFWNVVWQQDVRVIVMLTAEQEGGQVKAHNYWSGRQFGHLQLNFLGEHRASLEPSKIHRRRDRPVLGQRRSTNPPKIGKPVQENAPSPSSDQPYVIVRKFSLSNSDEPFLRMREVTQLQYSSWPDFGAPAHPAHLLGLIEQCDAVVRQVNGGTASSPDPPNSRPVLVHCSAGCGRTGTFCTVDTVIDMLKRQRQSQNLRQGTPMDVDASSNNKSFFDGPSVEGNWVSRDDQDLIEKTVEDFRLQRLSMVQSLRQFVLCYESVMEWLAEQYPKSA